MSSPESLSQRIHAIYGRLPEREKRVAELVLVGPGDIALRTVSELAGLAGVSNATVSRFFQRLGYNGYDEARRASRAMRAKGSPLYLVEGQSGAGEKPRANDLLRVETGLIERSLEMLNPLTADDLAAHLATARRLRVAGFRNSRFLADYLVAALSQFRPDVEPLIPAGLTISERLAGLSTGDLIVIIGLRRRPRDFTEFVRAAVSTGAHVALVADESIREAPAFVQWSVTVAVNTPQSMDSYVGAMAVIRMIMLQAATHLGRAGHEHLEKIERLHEDLSELE